MAKKVTARELFEFLAANAMDEDLATLIEPWLDTVRVMRSAGMTIDGVAKAIPVACSVANALWSLTHER